MLPAKHCASPSKTLNSGGLGNDTISGDAGSDDFSGDEGNDLIDAGTGTADNCIPDLVDIDVSSDCETEVSESESEQNDG